LGVSPNFRSGVAARDTRCKIAAHRTEVTRPAFQHLDGIVEHDTDQGEKDVAATGEIERIFLDQVRPLDSHSNVILGNTK
jgi:hypothetical protein